MRLDDSDLDWVLPLNLGFIIAFFNLSGNIPWEKDWLLMMLKGIASLWAHSFIIVVVNSSMSGLGLLWAALVMYPLYWVTDTHNNVLLYALMTVFGREIIMDLQFYILFNSISTFISSFVYYFSHKLVILWLVFFSFYLI